MIISDKPLHKIDIEFVPSFDNKDEPETWLQITSFYCKGTTWETKMIRISPQASRDLYSFLKKQFEETK